MTCLVRDIKATPPHSDLIHFSGKRGECPTFIFLPVIDGMGQIRRAEMKGEKTEGN